MSQESFVLKDKKKISIKWSHNIESPSKAIFKPWKNSQLINH